MKQAKSLRKHKIQCMEYIEIVSLGCHHETFKMQVTRKQQNTTSALVEI